MSELGTITMSLDELEALRLCYLEGLYQEQAAEKMQVSRQTIGRIVTGAVSKMTEALVEGKAIRIEGGNVIMKKKFTCSDCGHNWEKPYGTARPSECPSCGSRMVHRAEDDRGIGRRRGHGRGNQGSGMGRCRRRSGRQTATQEKSE